MFWFNLIKDEPFRFSERGINLDVVMEKKYATSQQSRNLERGGTLCSRETIQSSVSGSSLLLL